MDVYADGTCYVEFTLKPQTTDEDGDFRQAEVSWVSLRSQVPDRGLRAAPARPAIPDRKGRFASEHVLREAAPDGPFTTLIPAAEAAAGKAAWHPVFFRQAAMRHLP